MRRYEKYKDSGIEWVGEIPEHWFLQKCKYLFKEHTGNGFPEDMQGETSGNIPFYKVSDLNGIGIYVNESNNYVSFEDIELKKWNIIPKGSILTAKIGEALRKNHRKICTGDCIVDNNCLGLEPQGIDYKYAFYILKTVDFDWFVNPGAVPSVSMDKLRSFFIPITTNPDEQIAIANYLDKKTADIDELIKQKEELLLLFEEEKKTVINNAVTKGIKANVRLKDSGIDWLGEKPENWEVKKLKYVVKLITEKNSDELQKVGLENIESNTGTYIETNSNFEGEGIHFKVGDILYGKLRPYLAKVFLADFEGAAVGDFFVLRPLKNVLPSFVKYRLLSTSFTEISNSSTYGSKMPRVSWEYMSDLFFAWPDFDEQNEIVQYIENYTSTINQKVIKTKILIEQLKEYKTALISEVATGKVKVIE